MFAIRNGLSCVPEQLDRRALEPARRAVDHLVADRDDERSSPGTTAASNSETPSITATARNPASAARQLPWALRA